MPQTLIQFFLSNHNDPSQTTMTNTLVTLKSSRSTDPRVIFFTTVASNHIFCLFVILPNTFFSLQYYPIIFCSYKKSKKIKKEKKKQQWFLKKVVIIWRSICKGDSNLKNHKTIQQKHCRNNKSLTVSGNAMQETLLGVKQDLKEVRFA